MAKKSSSSESEERAGKTRRAGAPPVTSLARGLEILRSFQPGDGLLGNQEIAARTGLAKSTVSRLTATLASLGYLEHLPRLQKYRVGPAVLALGYAFLNDLDLRRAGHHLMQELADHAAATVTLSVRDRLSMLYIDICHGTDSASMYLDIGSQIPIASSAAGFAFLAASSAESRAYFMRRFEEKYGSDWPGMRREINRGIREVEERGFCIASGLVEPTINAVAAPLVSPDRARVLAVNCTAPSFLLTEDVMQSDIGPRLVNLVANINAQMARYGLIY